MILGLLYYPEIFFSFIGGCVFSTVLYASLDLFFESLKKSNPKNDTLLTNIFFYFNSLLLHFPHWSIIFALIIGMLKGYGFLVSMGFSWFLLSVGYLLFKGIVPYFMNFVSKYFG